MFEIPLEVGNYSKREEPRVLAVKILSKAILLAV